LTSATSSSPPTSTSPSRATSSNQAATFSSKTDALTLDHCSQLIQLAKDEENRILAIGHELRMSSLGKVKELIDSGAIGEPLYALIELWRRPTARARAAGATTSIASATGSSKNRSTSSTFAAVFLQRRRTRLRLPTANSKQPDHPELHDNFSAILKFPAAATPSSRKPSPRGNSPGPPSSQHRRRALGLWSGAMDRTFEPTFSLKLPAR